MISTKSLQFVRTIMILPTSLLPDDDCVVAIQNDDVNLHALGNVRLGDLADFLRNLNYFIKCLLL